MVAVVFAAVSGWGIIFPVCQSEKLRISESAPGTAEHAVLWEEVVTNSCPLSDD